MKTIIAICSLLLATSALTVSDESLK